ncbi:MAG: sigma-E factor negative regulatory protein [Gammaproteobacteria bacterium]|nr:sigma-E factor negative regulatory protein [Gammaproteobacteria bacterium]
MREKLEILSAMVDDELDIESQQSLTDELLANPAMKGAWRRYNLIGEVLREEYAREPRTAMRPQPVQPWHHVPQSASAAKPLLARWMPIAASMVLTVVGTITVTGMLRDARPSLGPGEIRAIVEQLPVVQTPTADMADAAASDANQVALVRYEESVPMEHDERLESYIVNFNEQRVNRGMPGVHPYVRIVGYETAR